MAPRRNKIWLVFTDVPESVLLNLSAGMVWTSVAEK